MFMIKLELNGQLASLGRGGALLAPPVSRHRSRAAARPASSDLDEGSGFFRGLAAGLALMVPFWTLTVWCVGRLLG